jgi:hypothetical protein
MMDGTRFDHLLQLLPESRRAFLGGAMALTAGWLGVSTADAKQMGKQKKRKLRAKPNAFGCLEVGDPCRNAGRCCSGICKGKKGKHTCRAHGVGTCSQDQPDWCSVESLAEEHLELAACNGRKGLCIRTTAASNACINFHACADCKKDADCAALGYPAGSVCAPFAGNLACAGFCPETSGMACFTFSPIDDE